MKRFIEIAKRDIVYIFVIFILSVLYGWELTQ